MSQDKKRIVNWWMRWEDLNWPSHDGLDRIKERAEKLAEANVTTAMLFGAHFRWDFMPYFTLLHDYIATVTEELHKYGIEFYDRHSVNLIHRYDTREEMRHVMLHSGPHLPFSPSREAAASWEYKGSRLNDWRMIDVRTNEPLYYPQYAGEGFCYRNPDYIEAYKDYVKTLIADTGIDGLAAEDPVHYMHYISCGCPHCRAELKKRTGIDLPPMEDRNFWGNWDNPAWREWIDLRYDSGSEFFEKLKPVFPENFVVTTCGANSASPSANGKASDARTFLSGSNYVHSEMSGNTPPYKHDDVTVNIPLSDRMSTASHHQAVAREKGVRCFTTGYGFTEPSANIIWAVNKVLDVDCCFSTLKDRLGLPGHILKELPDEEVIGKAFGFEKDHPELFNGEQIGQIGVYFSYETQRHTCFGNMFKGYYADYSEALNLLFKKGINAHTVFTFPENTKEYPVIVVASVAAMLDEEKDALRKYIANGGKVIVTGPTPLEECENNWQLPTKPDIEEPSKFFSTIANGVWHRHADWITKTKLEPSTEANEWRKVSEGLFYNPHRLMDGEISDSYLELCEQYIRPLPLKVVEAEGYLITMFESKDSITVQLLAEDYDVDIDHELDEMRFHRSRVNYVNKVEPIGITDKVQIATEMIPDVYMPFTDGEAKLQKDGIVWTITAPEKCAYMIIKFSK